ncbi:MAG: rubredoxin [Alphaproteobacteria bacterium]|jgi:rubredoxin
MPEAISFDATRSWSKELPNGTVVALREFDFQGPFAERDPALPVDGPQCFRVEQPPGSVVEPHFHVADEYQLIAMGGGRLGRHGLRQLAIHYAGAFTPYGPIVADATEGVVYFTLRPRRDPGALFLPMERAKLEPSPKRFFMAEPDEEALAGEVLATWPAPSLVCLHGPEKDGAAAWRATLGPGQRMTPPKPGGDGYYIVVTGGSWLNGDTALPLWSCAFVAQGEAPLELLAGADGLDAVIMQFPVRHAAVAAGPLADGQHECPLCGFVYDAADGLPEDGIAPGVSFSELPADWTCPNCDAAKSEFEALG